MPAAVPSAPEPENAHGHAAAAQAGLRWVNDDEPGLTRRRAGSGFSVRDAKGRAVRDPATLARIRQLAIPPAWREVWICADPDGHLQATGLDARGRKQYRYHAQWLAERGATKFERLVEVGRALPRIRARVQRALAGREATPTRERVLATIVRLLDTTWLRIGNEAYARENGSFGLTTLRNRHASIERAGAALRLEFVGKGGIRHSVALDDRRVARVVRRCRELPGQALFQWTDAQSGEVRTVGSSDVNEWLAQAAGTRITAKDFRTWHGSVQALELTLAACAEGALPCKGQDVLREVARRLGNTPAVCRKAYIHPEVLAHGERLGDAAARAALAGAPWVTQAAPSRGLRQAERQLLGLLGAPRRRRRPAAPAPPRPRRPSAAPARRDSAMA
jgi:DNA topoisomerase-1